MQIIDRNIPAVNDRFITRPQACEIVGCSQSTLIRWEAAGEFPARRQIGKRRIAYRLSEVEGWLETRPLAEL